MLILTRKPNERISIVTEDGTRVTIVLMQCSGSRARLGVTAPKEVQVLREELASPNIIRK